MDEHTCSLERELLTLAADKPEAAWIVAAMSPDVWSDPVYAAIAHAIGQLVHAGKPVALASISEQMGTAVIRELWGDGGWKKLEDCLSSRTATLPPGEYRRMILEAAARRKLGYSLDDAKRMLSDGNSTADVWERIEQARPTTDAQGDDTGLICMADVKPEPVSWLWPGWLALGRITLLAGRPGQGKSFATMDIAARVSTGTRWPDGQYGEQGSVLLLCAEDDATDTIRPRLDAHSADCTQIQMMPALVKRNGKQTMLTLDNVAALRQALQAMPNCKLIIIDPIGSYLGKTDAHRDNEVRSVLAPVAALAAEHGVAVLVVAHTRKGKGEHADDLVMGSVGFIGIARVVMHLRVDPQDKSRRLLLPGKNNLAREGIGLAFKIQGQPPALDWEVDPVTLTADEVLAMENEPMKPGPEPEALGKALEWLRTALADGPRLARELQEEWKNGEDGSERTLKRAKASLGVKAYRETVPGLWLWRMPDTKNANKEANLPNNYVGHLGTLANNTEFLTNYDSPDSNCAKLNELGIIAARSSQQPSPAKRRRVTL